MRDTSTDRRGEVQPIPSEWIANGPQIGRLTTEQPVLQSESDPAPHSDSRSNTRFAAGPLDLFRSYGNAITSPTSPRHGADGEGAAPPVTMHLNNANVRKALEMLSRQGGMNILVSPAVQGKVTANLEQLDMNDALNAILRLCHLVAHRENGVVYVYAQNEMPKLNRTLRVFNLDYISSKDAMNVIAGLLSPSGTAFITESSPLDNRRTTESVVVEDVPEFVTRIESYLLQADQAPRQVMIEVQILEVELADDKNWGVNLEHIADIAGSTLTFQTTGFANGMNSPAGFIHIDGSKVDDLVDVLQSTTDAKALAKPRILVVNGQKARIQIGEQLGYRVLTVTETSTVEDIKFLDVGVVLDVTPRISRDCKVLMRVKPEVSEGQINPVSLLPEEETTEVETDVLLCNGQGIVIGGLIQEKDSNIQSKIPFLGDLHLIGKLFQKKELIKRRTEIIVTLVPRVVPFDPSYHQRTMEELQRTHTPLVYGPLCRYPRPWEPRMPDAVCNPQIVRLPHLRARYLCKCGQPNCSVCNSNSGFEAAHQPNYFDAADEPEPEIIFPDETIPESPIRVAPETDADLLPPAPSTELENVTYRSVRGRFRR